MPLLDDCTAVECAGNKKHIPFLTFLAQPSSIIDEDIALSHFTRLMNRTERSGTVSGPAALRVYRSLGNRRVLATKEVRDTSGRLIVEEVGICGSLGYLYRRDTFPHVDLTLLSGALAENLVNGSMQLSEGTASK